MLSIRDLTLNEEGLTDFKELNRNRKVNGEKVITMTAIPTEKNQHSFKLVEEESVITFDNEEYVIKKLAERSIGNTYLKRAEAIHKFFVDMINEQQPKIHNGTMTFAAFLQFVFEGTGYTFSIIDSFSAQTFENLGNDNPLALLTIGLDRYKAEMEIVGKNVRFRRKIGSDTDFQFRYGHNIKAIEREVDTTNLATYIEGYGKKREEKDILSGVTIPHQSRQGTWTYDSAKTAWATSSDKASFKFSFTGTGFNFKILTSPLGGKWRFALDGKTTIKSTYQATSSTKDIEVFRGLKHGTYQVTVTYAGKDSDNPNTKPRDVKAINYLLGGNIISLYRERVGAENYHASASYTSPNASKYNNGKVIKAPTIQDERFTDNVSLLAHLKEIIIDEPQITLTIDFADLRAAGYPYTVPNEGDRVFIIYEPMNDLLIETRIMEINEVFDVNLNPVKTHVTLSNYKKSFTGTMMNNFQKALRSITNENGTIKYNVLDEAVRLATEALKSAQTELIFDNGILSIDKTNPNLMTLLNSAGFGVSSDGGNTFPEAITGLGINTSLLTAGQIHTNNIQIIGEDSLFFWDGTALQAYDPNDLTKYVKLNSEGLYIAKGAMTIERPDGYTVVNNGLLNIDYNIQPHYPPYIHASLNVLGWWITTPADTDYYPMAYYNFKHTARYLKITFYSRVDNSGASSAIRVRNANADDIWAYAGASSTDPGGEKETVTIDLGVPNGTRKSFYIDLRSTVASITAYARILQVYMED